MLKAIEAYLALGRATGFAMLNAECLSRALPPMRPSAANACPCANRNRLGGAGAVRCATRRPAEGRLSLRASCPG